VPHQQSSFIATSKGTCIKCPRCSWHGCRCCRGSEQLCWSLPDCLSSTLCTHTGFISWLWWHQLCLAWSGQGTCAADVARLVLLLLLWMLAKTVLPAQVSLLQVWCTCKQLQSPGQAYV